MGGGGGKCTPSSHGEERETLSLRRTHRLLLPALGRRLSRCAAHAAAGLLLRTRSRIESALPLESCPTAVPPHADPAFDDPGLNPGRATWPARHAPSPHRLQRILALLCVVVPARPCGHLGRHLGRLGRSGDRMGPCRALPPGAPTGGAATPLGACPAAHLEITHGGVGAQRAGPQEACRTGGKAGRGRRRGLAWGQHPPGVASSQQQGGRLPACAPHASGASSL